MGVVQAEAEDEEMVGLIKEMIKITDIGWDVGVSSISKSERIIKEMSLPTELVLVKFNRDERDLIVDFLYDEFGTPIFGYKCEPVVPDCKISTCKKINRKKDKR